MPKHALIWLRNELRLRDNPLFHQAVEQGYRILPVYCFEDRLYQPTPWGFPRTDAFRAQCILQSLQDLRAQLQAKGGDLLITQGKASEIIPKLVEQHQIEVIFCSEEMAEEEKQSEQAVEQAVDGKARLQRLWNNSLIHPQQLPYPIENLPDIFTQFRKTVEKQCSIRAELAVTQAFSFIPIETKELNLVDLGLEAYEVDERAVLKFKGGESEAWERIRHYFWETECLSEYKKTRNGLIGSDYSSKLSAWLAVGCISPVSIYHEVKRYEQQIKKNQSTYWLFFELLWREYFRFVALKYGKQIFVRKGIKGLRLDDGGRWQEFEKWMAGETGNPFVDANMRELNATAFMSNRGRQNVASYLVKDLRIDWRLGAWYFESKLVDYDVYSNWGNWMYVAGVGNDPRPNRYFNVVGQAKRYDKDGAYIRLWLPELADLPTAYIFEPWRLPKQFAKEIGFQLGHHYPHPAVKPAAAK